jgi:hypothetical protein
MNLTNILPPTPEQIRNTQATISVAEKPIKEFIFAYLQLFSKSTGPKFKRYREMAETMAEFAELPAAFADTEALYYIPIHQPCPQEEVLVRSTETTRSWEMWELRPAIVDASTVWDANGAIAALTPEEASLINAVIGKLLHIMQLSWTVITSRYAETKDWKLRVHADNLTLALVDSGPASKSDHLNKRLAINIIVKDKIETHNSQ